MLLTPDEVIELFRRTGAYLTGHFQLTSGLHSSEYLQCALVLQHPGHAEKLGRSLARTIEQSMDGQRPEVVVSPAIGGIVIGHEVGRAFGIPAIFAERDSEKRMTLRRGFSLGSRRAVVIEDVITTGGSTREVVELIRREGGAVLAAGSIIDRSGGAADAGARRVALAELQVQAWNPGHCPLCASGAPVEKPGSRPV